MKRLFTALLIVFLGYFQISGLAAGNTHTQHTKDTYHFNIDENTVLYPNPAVDYLYVRIDLLKTRFTSPDFEVRNILGNKIPIRAEQYREDTYRISVNEFPSGYYLLTVSCNECSEDQSTSKESYKFLKQ